MTTPLGERRFVDDVRVRQPCPQLIDFGLHKALRLALAVVLGVFAKVPLGARFGDLLRDLGHLDIFEVFDLVAQLFVPFPRCRLAFHITHLASTTSQPIRVHDAFRACCIPRGNLTTYPKTLDARATLKRQSVA